MTQITDSNILKEADQIVSVERQQIYGSPAEDFSRSTQMLTACGFRFQNPNGEITDVKPEHIPMIMTIVKLARLANNTNMFHRDSWLDIAGYAKTADMVHEVLYVPPKKATRADNLTETVRCTC